MARLAGILNAVGRAVRRDLGTYRALKTNNFFLFIALLIYSAVTVHLAPKSAYPLLLLLFFVLLFPLSSDPLDKVPPSRLALWPLTSGERFALRLASLGLSPVLWLVIAMALLMRVAPEFAPAIVVAAVGVQGAAALGRGFMSRRPGWTALRYVPRFPGRLGGLIRNNVRQTLSVLDTYVAAILCIGGCAYRFLGANPEPEAFSVLALLIGLAMSTYANCLFGLDQASSATTRYRLLPLRGWEILLAKDTAFLGILFVLVLPLSPLAGLTFGFVALAVGHHGSVFQKIRMRRWRFAGTRVFLGVTQGVAGIALGFAEYEHGAVFFFASVAAYLVSLWFYGWQWDRRRVY